MRTNIKEQEYTRPELKLVSLYGEGYICICISDEVVVDEFVVEGEEEIEI